MTSRNLAVVFGATGALGQAIVDRFSTEGRHVVGMTREKAVSGLRSLQDANWARTFSRGSVSSVVWAQGLNAQGSIHDDGPSQVSEVFEANILFVVQSLRELLDAEALAPKSRLVVVSSIWQEVARDHKLAYGISKAAVAGLVRSLVADLGSEGIAVNAVLPGVVDTPMTREFLNAAQIERLQSQTPGQQLVTPGEVAAVCTWLAGPNSSGVNGEFIRVDAGWTGVRDV